MLKYNLSIKEIDFYRYEICKYKLKILALKDDLEIKIETKEKLLTIYQDYIIMYEMTLNNASNRKWERSTFYERFI